MSKEMMIVFVYDTCRIDDFMDPAKSVIYFHPSWVSETQKLLLCGQLMGTTHFLNDTLFRPRIICLQSGKFAIKAYGRFIMAVGSDRNISQVILEHRANFLQSLIKMYHCDINTIYEHLKAVGQQAKFADKMFSIIESYLPLLQYNGNIFQNVSSLKIPKSASNLYLEATQILQSFQQINGVLGGIMLYHNKVVASQLSDSLTKIFTLSDLYRLKTSEHITANYHIPNGVTLINAYIQAAEYAELMRYSTQSHNLFLNFTAKELPFQMRKKSFSKETHSLIKQDKSLIFTHIPEEEFDDATNITSSSNQSKHKCSRPTYLPLLFKNAIPMDVTESGFNSINFDETDSFPNFIGKTSVCSTPMTENKLLPHGNVLSICCTASERFDERSSHVTTRETKDLLLEKDLVGSKEDIISYPIRMANSMPNLNPNISLIEVDGNIKEVAILMHNSINDTKICRSVDDPTHPIFSRKGYAVSYSLFKELLVTQYHDMKNCVDTVSFNQSNTKVRKEVVKPEPVKSDASVDIRLPFTKTVLNRKGRCELDLPLQTLNLDMETIQPSNIFEPKKVSGLQLTPLISKLTLLANNDQQSSGFSSWDTTPGCQSNPLEYQPKKRKPKILSDENIISKETIEQVPSKPVKVELFICVQQNMTLVLLLQEKSCIKEDMIHSLFETCVSKLIRIENNLHQAMSINVEGADKGDGSYSFICLDSKWDVNNRCGPWTPRDLLTLNSIHSNLHYNRRLIEFTVKSQDAVTYVYRCGRSEIYYQQSSITIPGLPPPQDVMGTVSLCAKRKLERDHRILLL